MKSGIARKNGMQAGVLTCLLAAVLVLGLGSAGLAESSGAGQPDKGQAGAKASQQNEAAQAERQELMNKYKRAQELYKELKSIQKQAVEENPELKEKQASVSQYMQSVLDKKLEGTDVDTKRMQEISQTLKSGNSNMTKAEKQELIGEYRGMAKEYQKARQEMMQDKEVQKRNKDLKDDMIQAMKQVNPEVDSMLEELRTLEASLRQKRLKMKQQQMRQQQLEKMKQQKGKQQESQ